MAVLPLMMVGVPTAGIAGGIAPLPLTESSFPCADGDSPGPPTAADDEGRLDEAVGENCFLDTLA